VYAEEIDGKTLLKKGKGELEAKRYEDAIQSLSAAEREFPLLRDYTLLWLSEAYQGIGNHKESLKTIRTLIESYPNSPLRKRARVNEIIEAQEVSEEDIQQLLESFMKDYPNDAEMKYAYARWLKNNDRIEAAKSIFKEIYIGAGPFSESAYSELDPSDMGVKDLIERASNLMKRMDFKEAGSAFKAALEKDDGSFKNEILKGLGYSLFKQKRYREAAEVYEEANEMFWKLRSLYRAGEEELFNSGLEELLKTGDKGAYSLLIAVASDYRRDGKHEEALKTYQNAIKRCPSKAEDSLWGIGWTYFLTEEYGKAADVFVKLYEDYHDTRYLYWKARSLEASGEDVTDTYHTLRKKGRDFYGIMSCLRITGCLEESIIHGIDTYRKNTIPVTTTLPVQKKFERFEALLELGLSEVALLELTHISKSATSSEDLLYIGLKFQDLEEYKYVVRLAERHPYEEGFHHLRYPRAYWDMVEVISEEYGVDPIMVLSLMREESLFDPHAKSPAGALGLMQLMPQTAFRLDNHLKLGIDNTSQIYNAANNIHLGTYYLSILMKEFNSYAYALAAYNAGEERVRSWIKKGNSSSIDEFIEDIPYRETRNYVKRVITSFFEYKRSSVGKKEIKNPFENL